MPDIPSKFQKDPSITFRLILLTHRQTDKQSPTKHNLPGGGNNLKRDPNKNFRINYMKTKTKIIHRRKIFSNVEERCRRETTSVNFLFPVC